MKRPRLVVTVPTVTVLVAALLAAAHPPAAAAEESARRARELDPRLSGLSVLAPGFELDDLVQNEGRVVFLPYAEYDGLLRFAEEPPTQPQNPFPWAIRRASYRLTVTKMVAHVQASYDLEVLEDGYCRIPIAAGDLAHERAQLDGKDVWMLPATGPAPVGTGPCAVLVKGKGPHSLAVDFSVQVAKPAGPNSGRIYHRVPLCPISTVTVQVDRPDALVRAETGVGLTSWVEGERTQARFALPPGADLAIDWAPRPAPRPRASVPATPEAPPQIDGEVRSVFHLAEELLTVESEARFDVKQGRAAQFKVLIQKGCQLTRIRDSKTLKEPSHGTREAKDGTVLTLRRETAQGGLHTFLLEAEYRYPSVAATDSTSESVRSTAPAAPTFGTRPTTGAVAPVPPSPATTAAVLPTSAGVSAAPTTAPVLVLVPFPTLLEVEQQSGCFALSHPPHLDVVVLPSLGGRMQRAEFPGIGGVDRKWAETFAYSALPTGFTIRIQPLRIEKQLSCEARHLKGHTVVSPEGTAITRLEYEITNSGRPLLEIELPARARIMSATLDGEAVGPGRRSPSAPASPATTVVVPLKVNPVGIARAFRLEIVYAEPAGLQRWSGSWTLHLPVTKLPHIGTLGWIIDLPDGYSGSVAAKPLEPEGDDPQGAQSDPVPRDRPDGPTPAPRAEPSGPPVTSGAELSLKIQPALPAPAVPARAPAGVFSQPRGLETKAAAPLVLEFAPPAAGRDRAHFVLQLAGPDPAARYSVAITYSELRLQRTAQIALYALTVVSIGALLWSSWPELIVAALFILLFLALAAAAVLGAPVAMHLGAGILTVVTCWVIRLVVGPAEEMTPK